ncbi:MAG: hypothetical protein JWQ23_4552, partial [Herminiimonas sp.]|nr:hypothetical protein [Herminiimonas sp.]
RPKPRRPASAVPAAAPEPPVAVPESKIPEQVVDVPREPAEPALMAPDSTAGPVAAGAGPVAAGAAQVDPVPLATSPSEAVAAVSAAESSQAIGPLYKFSLPPSVDLKYDVQALRDGQIVYGGGKISWKSDGVRYTVDGEAGILFFTLLNFRSSGEIDHAGVAPEVYSEKRFRRSETNTHFHRERNTISFSASTVSYPREGGEQDRASIIWQLTGIGRGDGEKFVSDAQFDFFVAGVRDGEPWRMRVIGMEEVETGSGRVGAWHLVRIPRPGSYDQKLDIWLAPQHEWYPVKLRFTEKNGDYLDMSLSSSTLAAAR